MAEQVFPTKGNLINTKKSLDLARVGFELLDRKRNIIVREMMALIDRAASIQSRIDDGYAKAYLALQRANVAHGICADIAAAVPVENGLSLSSRSVMGVEIPIVKLDPQPVELNYGFVSSSALVDEAYMLRRGEKADRRTGRGRKQRVPPGYSGQQNPKAGECAEKHHHPSPDLHGQVHHRFTRGKGAGGFLPPEGYQSAEKHPEQIVPGCFLFDRVLIVR